MRWHRHAKVTAEPLIERPSRSATLRDRLNSPWLVIAQYVFNVLVVILIAYVVGNQAQFSDYLNGRGEQRDRERDIAVEQANERAERSRETLCNLIEALERDLDTNLATIRAESGCPVR